MIIKFEDRNFIPREINAVMFSANTIIGTDNIPELLALADNGTQFIQIPIASYRKLEILPNKKQYFNS